MFFGYRVPVIIALKVTHVAEYINDDHHSATNRCSCVYIFKSDAGTHINDGANAMLIIVSDFL